MKKYYIGIVLLISLLSASAISSERKVYNNIDKNVKSAEFQHGWNFYEENNTSSSKKQTIQIKSQEKNAIALLQQILDENKKQTKLQKEIRDLLKSEYDPDPEVITLKDGTECIANSSAECYKMPITSEAKKIPVLVAFMKDPTNVEKAAAYAKWQSKHYQKAFDGGHALQFSTLQYADSSYSLPVYGAGFRNANGASDTLLRKKIDISKLHKFKDRYKLKIFVGLNADMDMMAFNNYMKFLKFKVPKSNYQIVFYDNDGKKIWDMLAQKFKTHKEFYKKEVLTHSIVNSKMFRKYKIYTSPTLVVLYKNKKDGITEARTVAVGGSSRNGFASSVIDMLELQKAIPRDKNTGYRNWLNYSDIAYDELKNRYNISVDKDVVERIKKKQRERINVFDLEKQGKNSEK